MNNKTYTILQSFDKYEVNRLRKFLQSPYFNMNEAIVALFEVFIKDIFGKKTKELEKESIWRKIYGQKKYDDIRFRKLNSELLKLVEKFLAQQIYEDNPIHQAVHLMQAVGIKKLEKLYSSTIRSARRLSEQQKHRPANFYFYQYEIEKNYYQLTEFENKRSAKSNIEEIAKNLDYFYFAEKLRIHSSILSRQQVTSYDYDLKMILEIKENVKNSDYDKITPIQIYHQINLLLTEFGKEEHYFKLRKLISENINQFPPEEGMLIYKYAINNCIYSVNKGNNKFLREYLDLYQELTNNKNIFESEELDPWSFKNTIGIALRLGEYDWAEKFILTYQNRIPEEFRENAVTFNLAQLYFYQKKYDNAITLLNQVEYEDLTYNLNSKLMLIAIYYETDEIEPLYSLFESFRVYLNRKKKIPDDRKQRFTNLIKFTKKLTRIIPGDKKAINKLKGEINETKEIVSLKWLKEKITELE